MSTMTAWDKRLRTPSLRVIAQNQSLGASYFPYGVLSATTIADVGTLRITEPLGVLEELARHGRCVVVLPGDAHLVLYFVESESGRSRVVWYARSPSLIAATTKPRWVVSVDLEPAPRAELMPATGTAATHPTREEKPV